MINKYELHFSNSEHIPRFDSIASRWIIEAKYMDVEFLKTIGLWDSLNELIRVAGWTESMGLAFMVYERLRWEFLRSLVVGWSTPYQNWPVHIRFRFSNRDFETNLAEFDQTLSLPHSGVWTVRHENFNMQSFWCEITRDKHTEVFENRGSRVAYSSSGSKVTFICNPTVRYLHRIIANTIFTRHESESRALLSEVFLIWCILKDE